jgi:hypothetical protein
MIVNDLQICYFLFRKDCQDQFLSTLTWFVVVMKSLTSTTVM